MRALGIVTVALGAVHAVGAGLLLVIGGFAFFPGPSAGSGLARSALLFLGGVIAMGLLATLGIAAGAGLVSRQGWARLLGFIFAGFNVVLFPFGTLYGAYAFWVLTREGVPWELDAPLPWA